MCFITIGSKVLDYEFENFGKAQIFVEKYIKHNKYTLCSSVANGIAAFYLVHSKENGYTTIKINTKTY